MAKYMTMRYNEILTESHADYAAMFRFLSNWKRNVSVSVRMKLINTEVGLGVDAILDKMIRRAEFEVDWARKYLRRYDRIIWWLRFVRVCILKDMGEKLAPFKNAAPQIMEVYHRLMNSIVVGSKIPVSSADVKDYYLSGVKRNLEHLYSLPIADIQNFHPAFENPMKLARRFKYFEKAWQQTRKGLIPYDANDGRILLRFPNGMVWMQLDRAACRQEGDAMGHCGNVPSQQPGETILSLRQPVKKGGEKFWKPYLTFILDANGHLGEMKGRFNLKPSLAHREGHAPSDFHDEIEALLRLPIIRGIKGGYKPEQNFFLGDLGDARRNNLVREFPHLATVIPPQGSGDDEDD